MDLDALDVLRRALQSGGGGATRDEATGDIVIGQGGTRISGKTPTRLASSKDGSWYTVEALWFAVKHREDNVPAYMRACNSAGIGYLYLPDRIVVTQYMCGEVQTIGNLKPLSELLPTLQQHKEREEAARKMKEREAQRGAAQSEAEAAAAQARAAAEKQARKARKAELREAMKQRLAKLCEMREVSGVTAEDVAADNSSSGVVGVGTDELVDLKVQKLRKRQCADDELVKAVDDTDGRYHELLELDKSEVEEIEKVCHTMWTRNNVMDAESGRDLANIDPNVANKQPVQHHVDTTSTSAPPNKKQRSAGTSASTASRKEGKEELWWLIVPNALTSPVTLSNVKDFLEGGVWVDPQRHTSATKQRWQERGFVDVVHEMRLTNATGGTTHCTKVRFRVVDSASKLKPDDWFVTCACSFIDTMTVFDCWWWLVIDDEQGTGCWSFCDWSSVAVP